MFIFLFFSCFVNIASSACLTPFLPYLTLLESFTKTDKVIAIAGATGQLGPSVVNALKIKGYKIIYITTKKASGLPNAVVWDPSNGQFDASSLEGVEAVINFAGENIASGDGTFAFLGRWTDSKKAKISSSRLDTTRLLVEGMSKLKNKPKVFISASGIGCYGHNDFETVFDERSTKVGAGFLAALARQWESEAYKAEALGVRVVCARLSVILSTNGGVLAKVLPQFKMGAGGILGNGQQPFPWMSTRDMARAIVFLIENPSLSGPVNLCSPDSDIITNEHFTIVLGRATNKSTNFPMPEHVAKFIFGGFGEELLLGGQRAVPRKLIRSGFKFLDSKLETALPLILEGIA
eukprot:gene11726-24594_t